ncbi:unannotated protein [freshwater metagenome]|uniref:Unannotated protein n=1 Tax=freshwater metagenome TaxID=449393 RepID=A0A6J7EHI5_9ZZZZ|nr:molybdopterin-dependent oxidoreductase [Actinomycetota bacterium]
MSNDTASQHTTSTSLSVGRRGFLGGGVGALLVFALDGSPVGSMAKALAASAPSGAAVTGWITVNTDNTVTIGFGGAEMGQGIMTGLAQAVAEELMVDWAQVRTQAAPASQSYITGGSYGVRGNFHSMRLAGAQAREMLLGAAAAQWSVPTASCTAAHGVVTNNVTAATLTYAQLASAAAGITPPSSPPLTDPSKFRIVGTTAKRTDLPGKVNGSAVFGIDVRIPGMVFAAIKNCPTIGGTLKVTPAVPTGALAVVPLGNAVAVVATNTWAAMNAAANMSVSWNTPANASQLTSSTILAQANTLMASGTPGFPLAEQVGDAPGAFAAATTKIDATYQLPYLAHVCMEVPNCTVSITGSTAEIWAPTQAPGWVVGTAAAITGLPAASITVHPTLLGGGLGRKIEQDYIAQAVKVAKAVGKPVQLVWSREEDFGHDQYRPMGLVRVRLGLDGSGTPTSYAARTVAPSPLFQRGWMGPSGNDNVEGATHLPYALPNRLVEYVRHPAAVPVGFWRSVGNSINTFAVESAIDEAALAIGADPLAFRQSLLVGDPRTLAVLNAAASMIGWATPPAAGVARGLAVSNGFGSIVALAIEVSQPVLGAIKVNRVACAVDCGLAVNPGQVEGQMQGGIIHGLTASLWGQTTFSSGRASSRNFSNTRMLKMSETPAITVQIIQSGMAFLGGVGEVAVPAVAPALANAYAKLTGTRVRTLPFFPGASMGG